ncbi:MAG: NUDIX domain-containing protein [Bdellovibrionales bacterium]
MDEKKYDILARETLFQGYFRVDRYKIRHERFAGGLTEPFQREVFERSRDVAGVLLFDPRSDKVILVEQFRAGIMAHGHKNPWTIEIVLGMVNGNETAEQAARREAMEEAGCAITDIQPISSYFSSPGGTTEHILLYVGRTTAPEDGILRGLKHEHEDIRVRVLDATRAIGLIYADRIQDAQTLVALQWFLMHHTELRSRWLVSDVATPII